MSTPEPIDEARATELARAAVELAGGARMVYRNPRQPFSPHSRKVYDVEGVPVAVSNLDPRIALILGLAA